MGVPSQAHINEQLLAMLRVSIDNLNAITAAAEERQPMLFSIEVEGSRLKYCAASCPKTTWDLLCAALPSDKKSLTAKKRQIQEILHSSIETLKKYYRLIQKKLKEGSLDQQLWAKKALDTINDYNGLLIRERMPPKTFIQRLVFAYLDALDLLILDKEMRRNFIEIPSNIFIRFDSLAEEPEEDILSRLADELKRGKKVDYTLNERDMFTMRAITMAKRSNLPEEFQQELTKMMRQTPIVALGEGGKDAHVVSMVQMLTPFPGEVITVTGKFKRSPKARIPSVPDASSFRVSTIVSQTGFPHPSQYTGWALSNSMVPDNPLRIDLTPEFHAIHRIKQQLATDLLPGQRLNQKAKSLLQLKKEAFALESDWFLEAHKKLYKALLALAPYDGLDQAVINERVDAYFSELCKHPAPFDFLAQTHAIINKFFVDRLFDALYHEWQDHQNDGLQSTSHKERHRESFRILHGEVSASFDELNRQLQAPQTDLDLATLRFVLLQGQVIGEAAVSLILQSFSEKIGFAPPLLKQFELIVQTATFRQVLSFEQELELELPVKTEALAKNMRTWLEKDIELFLNEGDEEPPEAEISHELERYYNARYSYLQHTFKKK